MVCDSKSTCRLPPIQLNKKAGFKKEGLLKNYIYLKNENIFLR
jgi:hypothetical protein